VLSDEPTRSAALAEELRILGATAECGELAHLETTIAGLTGPDDGLLRAIVVLVTEREDAAYLPIRLVQAWVKTRAKSRPRFWFVTRTAQAAPQGSLCRVSVNQAALWGCGRAIAEEHPELWGGLVDLDTEPTSGEPTMLARQLVAPEGEEQVALREGRRYVLRIAKYVPGRTDIDFRWRSDGALLITGGLGDIGLHVARAAAASGVRRIILLGRTALPPRVEWNRLDPATRLGRRVAAVRELEAMGISVQTEAVDVGDEGQLRAFLAKYEAEAWPRIQGVVHAAATVDDHLAVDMDRAAFDSVMRAKLRGAQLLDQLIAEAEVFVLFSSVVAYLGLAGASNYAAANAGLDALARDRRSRGLPAVSLAWGVWQDTGLASAEVASEFGRQGIQGFSPEQAIRLFSWLFAGPNPNVLVLRVDWGTLRRARAGRGASMYGELVGTGSADGLGTESGMSSRLAEATMTERRSILEGVVRDCIAKVLKIAPARLDPRRALGTMGLSSLMAIELRNRLEAALGRSLSATLAWNYPTVAALVEHLADASAAEHRPAEPPGTGTEEPLMTTAASTGTNTSEHFAQLAELSDEDAARVLRAERSRVR
jgi:NAD(P)-dependent dehydrogenase (short-subunit alcohol dehydrogenase family)/acyl carrier protein